MYAIFSKQLREAALPCALLATLSLVVFEASGFAPARRPAGDELALSVALGWGLAALLLGFWSFSSAEARGGHEQLLHRGLERTRLFRAQALANLTALAIALAVALGVHATLTLLRHDPLTHSDPQLGRYLDALMLSTSAVLGHGLGVVGAHLRRPRIVRLLCTLYAAAGLLFLTFVVLREFGDRVLSNEWLWLAWTLGVGAGLHLLAARMLRQGVDSEKPLAGPLRAMHAVVAIVIAAPATLLTVAQVQRWALKSAYEEAPVVGLASGASEPRLEFDVPTNSHLVARLFDPWKREEIRSGDEESRYYQIERDRQVFEFGPGWRHLLSKEQWLAAPHDYFYVQVLIGARNGRLLARAVGTGSRPSAKNPAQDAPAGLELPYQRELSRSDGQPFSQKLVLLPPPDGSQAWLVADAADRSLWRLDLAPAFPTLEQVGAPQSWSGIDVAIGRERAELEGPWGLRNSSRVVLLTPQGRRSWNGAELVAAELTPQEVWQSEADAVRRIELDVLDRDVFEPLVRVTSRDSAFEPFLQHYRAPLGPKLVAYAASLVRSPLGSIQSALDDAPRHPTTTHEWRDPLVAGARRPWLIWLNVALSLTLAFVLAQRRSHGLRAGWFVLFALFGPLTALLAGPLEARRAQLPAPPRRTLRIGARPTREPTLEPVAH